MGMAGLNRRQFLRAAGAGAAIGLVGGCAGATKGDVAPKSARRVVVVGGGWGGATAAKYVRLHDPSIEVRPVRAEPGVHLLPVQQPRAERHAHDGVDHVRVRRAPAPRREGAHEPVTAIESDTARVRVADGYIEYDRLIVSPGVDFQWEQVEGLAAAQDRVLHAWKAGPQTVALARQLEAMPDGGVFVLTVPPVAYRCPPGPYERVCQVAWYLKATKPRAKLIVLDANPNVVSKAALFRAAWQAYPNIEYRASSKVVKVDAGAREVTTELGDRVKYDVRQPDPAAAGGRDRGAGGPRGRRQALVRGEPPDVRVGEGHGHPRHRRRDDRAPGAEVGQCRQRHGQDVRERGGPPARRQESRRRWRPATPAIAG